MPASLFQLQNVWKTYSQLAVETHALRGVTLDIKQGEYVAIIGPSGSGKSTLLHMLGALDTPTKGLVSIAGEDISGLTSDELSQIRRDRLGFVFQSYNLIPGLTALENVALPLRFASVEKHEAESRAHTLLKQVSMEDRVTHKPSELSGGQQQRVSIARALVNDPDAILADEPTGNLDSTTSEEVVTLLAKLNKASHKTLIVVTHDDTIAKKAHHQIKIKDGQIQSRRRNK